MLVSLFAPLLTVVIHPLRKGKWSGWVLLFLLILSFSWFNYHYFQPTSEGLEITYPWFYFGSGALYFKLISDGITTLMLGLVWIIAISVALYSIFYINEKEQPRYFSFLALFVVAMTLLVMAGNLLVLFIGWELVGFSSYLLIGFWYSKPKAASAAKKAFLINRIGDLALIAAMAVFWRDYGTLTISELMSTYTPESNLVPILLYIAAAAKSAQLIMMAWLPDAMEGPTPVSALIHAATMVAAGIYLLYRFNFTISTEVGLIIAFAGIITSIYAALLATGTFDIKRLLAYSTISQLGLMMAGVVSFEGLSGFFHLITHGFYKAGLFLVAGILIHLNHTQDIRKIRLTGRTSWLTMVFGILSLALLGFPFTSGFLSKEALILAVFEQHQSNIPVVILFTSGFYVSVALTGIYLARLWKILILNGFSTNRISFSQKVVVITLAGASLFFVFSLNPFNHYNSYLTKLTGDFISTEHSLIITMFSVFVPVFAVVLTWRMFGGWSMIWLHTIGRINGGMDHVFRVLLIIPGMLAAATLERVDYLLNKILDLAGVIYVTVAHVIGWLDVYIVDGIVNLMAKLVAFTGKVFQRTQKVPVQQLMFWSVFGTVVILIWMIL